MAVIDCSLFFNELDVLEIRLAELSPVVDKFVFIEGNTTFTGKPKEDLSKQVDAIVSKYGDKVKWYKTVLPSSDSWSVEHFQRNSIKDAIKPLRLRDKDTIIISDIDEIPRASVIKSLTGTQLPVSLWLRKFSYRLNIETDEHHGSVKVMPYWYLKDKQPQDIRQTDIAPYVKDAGWEFSSLGSVEHIALKLRSFSHTELDVPGISDVESISRRLNNLEDVAGRGYKHRLVEIDETWPEVIVNNMDRWKDLIWK